MISIILFAQRLNLPVFVSHCWQSDSKLRFRTELRRFTISCTKKLKRKYLQRVGFFPFFSHQRLLQTFYDVEQARIGIVRSLFSQFSKEHTSTLSPEFTANQQITLNHISRKVHRICNFYTDLPENVHCKYRRQRTYILRLTKTINLM